MCGPRPLCLGVSQGRPGSLCFQVWLRHTRGEDPLQSHNWVHLPAHWQLEASQSQLCWAPAQWAGGITVCGSRETPASAPPPLALRRARARGPGRARAPAHLAQPLARRQQRRRRSGRARARSRRSGGRGPRTVHSGAVRRRGHWAPRSGRRKRRLQSGGGLATLSAPGPCCPPRGLTDAPARPRPRVHPRLVSQGSAQAPLLSAPLRSTLLSSSLARPSPCPRELLGCEAAASSLGSCKRPQRRQRRRR